MKKIKTEDSNHSENGRSVALLVVWFPLFWLQVCFGLFSKTILPLPSISKTLEPSRCPNVLPLLKVEIAILSKLCFSVVNFVFSVKGMKAVFLSFFFFFF